MIVQNYYKTIMLGLGALLGFTTVLGIVLASNRAMAEDTSVVDEINITVPVSCTMSGTGMQSHNANINNGLYDHDIGSTVLHAFCNDNEGFAIYAAGYTGNEVGGTNSNKLVGTTASGNATIESGIATTAGNPDVSNWAMKLTMTQDSGDTTTDNAFTIDSAPNVTNPSQAESGATQAPFSNYHVVPNEYVKVAHKNSGTDMTDTTGGVKLTTTYAAYISKTQPADTYSGQVIYTLVHPSSADAPLVCNPDGTSISEIKCMQDISLANRSSILASMDEDAAYILYDSRDSQQYHVAKLAGGIWMLDNLALDPTNPTTAANMNETNTNATTAAIDNFLHGGSATVGWSNVAVKDIDTDFGSRTEPRINNSSKDTLVTSYGLASVDGKAKVGIYYNLCAASVGTYCYPSGSDVDIPGTLVDVSQDLCPANWHMPTGGRNSGESFASAYYVLTQLYRGDASSTNSVQYKLSTPLSGNYGGSSVSNQNNNGVWWSSTRFEYPGLMYGLYVSSTGSLSPDFVADISRGYSIRCML